jgi:hypothetical protein
VREALAQLAEAVEDCQSASLASLSDEGLLSCLDACAAVAARVAAVQMRIIERVEVREIARSVGASSTKALVRDRLRLSPSEAKRLCDLATALSRLDVLATGLGEGRVNVGQAEVIVKSLGELPPELGAIERAKAEAHLVDLAAQFSPADLGTLGRHLIHVIDPDWAERHEAEAVRREEDLAYARRSFTLAPDHLTGRVRVTGWLDAEAAAIVRAAIDPLCAPGATLTRLLDRDGLPAVVDDRSPGQRRADAIEEVCRYVLAAGHLPESGGDRPQITVTVGFDPLRQALGVGMLDTGVPVSPETARRLACDAQIVPAVLDGAGAVLDLGRERRLWSGPARRAVLLRDKGCAFPGCDRPARWTDIHHVHHWAHGGSTDLNNAVALCGHHHRVIHQDQWQVKIATDGLPTFTPPAWVDRQQRPRRNTYHRRP